MDIKERLNIETKGHKLYNVRREEFKSGIDNDFAFRVSPKPFKLNKAQKEEMENLGKAICDYFDGCVELYMSNEVVRELLDRGKPEKYKNCGMPRYLFLRPDLILTPNGFSVCEIETSPFGLGLAEVLNRTYGNSGFDPIVNQNELSNYVQSQISQNGTIAYSEKVKAFSGQLDFLAQEVFSGKDKKWNSQNISENTKIKSEEVYRAFYLNDEYKDPRVAEFLQEPHIYLPSATPQFEEKAMLSFIWDKRFVEFFKEKLGKSSFELLRKSIPKTWIVGEEEFVDGGLPEGKKDSIDLTSLGKSKRRFVLKQSGFNEGSSWGEGVIFLHKKGKGFAEERVKEALADKSHLYIIQEFTQGKDVPMTYVDENYDIKSMIARIRITPYFSYRGKSKGKMVAVKVTGCENTTEYIHAGTASINTAVIEEDRDL